MGLCLCVVRGMLAEFEDFLVAWGKERTSAKNYRSVTWSMMSSLGGVA